MPLALANDVTLAEVIAAHTLTKPLEYMRGVLENLHSATRRHGAVYVRLGLASGQHPNYRIDSFLRSDSAVDDEERHFTALEAYNGRDHHSLARQGDDAEILKDEHWSTRGTSHPDVQALFRSVAAETTTRRR